MLELEKYNYIKEKYGHYASWAIWASEGDRPKDNMGDLSVFDLSINKKLLQELNPNIILCGLNISARIETPLSNFHGKGGGAYKIRYALHNTPLWGAYMTDIIKDFEQKSSGKVMQYLRKNRQFEEDNVITFRQEWESLGVKKPTLIAFGGDAYSILERNLGNEFPVLKIPHYSNYTGKEKYREQVKSILENRQEMQTNGDCQSPGNKSLDCPSQLGQDLDKVSTSEAPCKPQKKSHPSFSARMGKFGRDEGI